MNKTQSHFKSMKKVVVSIANIALFVRFHLSFISFYQHSAVTERKKKPANHLNTLMTLNFI